MPRHKNLITRVQNGSQAIQGTFSDHFVNLLKAFVYSAIADLAGGRYCLEIAEPLPRCFGTPKRHKYRTRSSCDEAEYWAQLKHARQHRQVLRRHLCRFLRIDLDLVTKDKAISHEQMGGILTPVCCICSRIEQI